MGIGVEGVAFVVAQVGWGGVNVLSSASGLAGHML